MLGIISKIMIGILIFIVMLFFITFTTRDVQRVEGCRGSVKTVNSARMFIRCITFLIAEADAYLVIIKGLPALQTIGISLIAYLPAFLLAFLASRKGKTADDEHELNGEERCFVLFLLVLIALSIFSVYFMTVLGRI